MELQHLDVLLPAVPADGFDPAEAIPVFHAWVRTQGQGQPPAGLLIDVADYRHVPGGPGVLLIGHEADYALAPLAGAEGVPAAPGAAEHPPALGLRYQRKAALPGSNAERLAQALGAVVGAAGRLAAEPALAGRLRFHGNGLRVTVNDRLLAPNTPASAERLLPELRAWFAALLGHAAFRLEPEREPRRRFAVTLHSERPVPLEALRAGLDA